MSLNYTITGNMAEAKHIVFVCHGIFGSGRNWKGFMLRLQRSRPDCCFVLIDLRCHGDSPPLSPPHTLRSCAGDLFSLAAEIGTPDAVIGHSFGGKVAIEYGTLSEIEEVWMLDSPPGLRQDSNHGEVAMVISALRDAPLPFAKRKDLMLYLLNSGFSRAISQWMTTNLRSSPQGYIWKFDLEGIESLLLDYFRRDFWSTVIDPPAFCEIHVVKAELSDRWDSHQLEQLHKIDEAYLHLLPMAGHWLHVDNPQGLLTILRDRLCRD